MIEKSLTNLETNESTDRPAKKSVRTKNRAFCILCAMPVELVSFQEAASLLKKLDDEVFNLVYAHKLHCVYNKKAILMVCFDSLLREVENQMRNA